ncbi:MAG: hypothetical protein IK118_06930 [Clostridia bacterium]|nr:hypothetical protein [Clostridia bacterium]
MLLSYNDCRLKYGSDYKLSQAVAEGLLVKLDRGVYSMSKKNSPLAVLSFKYPNAVFASESAFYFHSLTDVIPEKYHLATERNAAKIRDADIRQIFYQKEQFPIGITTIDHLGDTIRIYDPERMLIELIRNKKKLPFDYYKEIIRSYRRITDELDFSKLEAYLSFFPRADGIFDAIQLEVL